MNSAASEKEENSDRNRVRQWKELVVKDEGEVDEYQPLTLRSEIDRVLKFWTDFQWNYTEDSSG